MSNSNNSLDEPVRFTSWPTFAALFSLLTELHCWWTNSASERPNGARRTATILPPPLPNKLNARQARALRTSRPHHPTHLWQKHNLPRNVHRAFGFYPNSSDLWTIFKISHSLSFFPIVSKIPRAFHVYPKIYFEGIFFHPKKIVCILISSLRIILAVQSFSCTFLSNSSPQKTHVCFFLHTPCKNSPESRGSQKSL